MAIWDGLGQQNVTDAGDNGFAHHDPEPVERYDTMDDMEEAVDAVDDTTDGDPEPVEEAAEEASAKDGTTGDKPRRKTRGKTNKNTFPHIDAAVARRVKELFDALSDPRAVKVAAELTDARGSDPAVMVDALTDARNKKRIEAVVSNVRTLSDAGADDLKARLVYLFAEDKTMAKTLFAVLNALEPERGFGRASDDLWKNACAIADKWGDGVDMSLVERLLV